MKKTTIKQKRKIIKLQAINIKEDLIENIAKKLTTQMDEKIINKKYATIKTVLILAGAGAFLAASIAMPNLPLVLKPFLEYKEDKEEDKIWKRFNIPYLKRTLNRLEKQKLIEIVQEENLQVVKITNNGRRKILKYAINGLVIEKPEFWDGKWRLVSYDVPKELKSLREVFREYLKVWKFYPLHESVFLHAYPCEQQVEFLREYLGIGEHVRIFSVSKIENDKPFREFFDL